MVDKILEWIRCPVGGNKTRVQIQEDTELKNFPLYCPKCKQESVIEVKDLQVNVKLISKATNHDLVNFICLFNQAVLY